MLAPCENKYRPHNSIACTNIPMLLQQIFDSYFGDFEWNEFSEAMQLSKQVATISGDNHISVKLGNFTLWVVPPSYNPANDHKSLLDTRSVLYPDSYTTFSSCVGGFFDWCWYKISNTKIEIPTVHKLLIHFLRAIFKHKKSNLRLVVCFSFSLLIINSMKSTTWQFQ